MITEVLIDRSTIRFNPLYGQEYAHLTGYVDNTLEVRDDLRLLQLARLTAKLCERGWLLQSHLDNVVIYTAHGKSKEEVNTDVGELVIPLGCANTTGYTQHHNAIRLGPQSRFMFKCHTQCRTCPICDEQLEVPEDVSENCLFCMECDTHVGDEQFTIEVIDQEEMERIAKENAGNT